MPLFLQLAAGLGVGAFCAAIFYLISKQLGKNKGEGIQTSKIGPKLTATIYILIVVVAGGITVVALVLYAPSDNPPSSSVHAGFLSELQDTLTTKLVSGNEFFAEASRRTSDEERKAIIDAALKTYKRGMIEAIDAAKKGHWLRYHVAIKEVIFTLNSPKLKQALPPDLRDQASSLVGTKREKE